MSSCFDSVGATELIEAMPVVVPVVNKLSLRLKDPIEDKKYLSFNIFASNSFRYLNSRKQQLILARWVFLLGGCGFAVYIPVALLTYMNALTGLPLCIFSAMLFILLWALTYTKY